MREVNDWLARALPFYESIKIFFLLNVDQRIRESDIRGVKSQSATVKKHCYASGKTRHTESVTAGLIPSVSFLKNN